MNGFQKLAAMKKMIFDYSNFFGSGHFSIHQIWKNGSKKDRSQNVKGFKNYSFHVCWSHERIFEICFVFTDFFARASTSLQFDIQGFRKTLFALINFFDMSYLKITFQTQFSGTLNTLVFIAEQYINKPWIHLHINF